MKVTLIGRGKVGTGLARALREVGQQVTLLAARDGLPARAITGSLLILTVRDADLAGLAHDLARTARVSRQTAVLHVAGGLSPEVLAPLRGVAQAIGQAHPALSFASEQWPPRVQGAALLVTGEPLATKRAESLARVLGMVPVVLSTIDPVLYHAGCALLANGAAALAASSLSLLESAGMPRQQANSLLGTLLASVAQNVHAMGLPAALTGPVRRADADTVRAHLSCLQRQAPGLVGLYVALVQAQLPLAQLLGEAKKSKFRELARLLRDSGAETRSRTRARSSR